VDTFFKTLAKLASNYKFLLAVRKQLVQYIEIVSEREKTLARLASGFVFLLVNPDFYSHLASWRVVIRTPLSHTSCLKTIAGFDGCIKDLRFTAKRLPGDGLLEKGLDRLRVEKCSPAFFSCGCRLEQRQEGKF
jgi:hypothetical protein